MKIVLTGAAGALGQQLRAPLAKLATELVSTDLVEVEDLAANESFVKADLGRLDEVVPLVEGADMVVHFGAIADEAPFDAILRSNILGAYNVWEASHRAGVRRIVYASSVHAVGMWRAQDGIGPKAEHRPDTYYGLAKCFAEDLARMFWEKRGLEAVCIRIFSCTKRPMNVRALGTWLSYADLAQLVERSVTTRVTGFCTVNGVSANDRAPMHNVGVEFLGYRPKDNAEDYAAELLEGAPPGDPQDLAQSCIGGPFATVPLGESGVAHIKAMNK